MPKKSTSRAKARRSPKKPARRTARSTARRSSSASISRRLAEFACALEWKHLTPAAVREAKRFWVDTLGCALGGYKSHDLAIAMPVYRKRRSVRGEATVIGGGWKTSARDAAFLNNLMIRAMDFNDIYWVQDPSHPSDMLGTALAVAEARGGTGKDLIVATVLAYEIEMRLCEAAFPGIREIGWHHATLTQLAAPLVAGKLMGLDPERMTHAVGIGGCRQGTFGGVVAGKLTMMKNTVDPMAGAEGVTSALLAEAGYTGPEQVFEGKEGLTHCLGAQTGVKWKLDVLTDGLADLLKPRGHRSKGEFRIVQCGMKAFPTEALTHSPISCALDLAKGGAIPAAEIQKVVVKTIARAKDILADPSKYVPSSKETADHSLPYTIAVALLDGKVTTEQFEKKRLKDPGLPRIMARIEVVADASFERRFPRFKPAEVILHRKGKPAASARVSYPKGDARNPMSDKDIENKFRALASRSLSVKRQDGVLELVGRLPSLPSVRPLLSALRAGS